MNAVSRSIIAHYQRGEFDQADVLCAETLAADPGNATALHMRGILAIQRKDFTNAVAFLTTATTHQPDNDEGLINLGIAHYGLGQFNESITALKRGLRLNRNSAEGYLYLGRCYLALGAFAKAENALQSALALRSRWPDAVEALATTAWEAGFRDSALGLALKTLSLAPGRPEAHRIAAEVLVSQRQLAAAAEHYKAALTVAADNVRMRTDLALILTRLGRDEEAIAEYRRALQHAPNDPRARHGLACVLLSLGNFREGWPLYKARFEMELYSEAARATGKRLERLPRMGERIVAWSDQGVGEQVMFASFIPQLIRTGAEVAVECDHRLVPLLRRSFPEAAIFAHTAPPHPALAAFDDGRFCFTDAGEWLRNSFSEFPSHTGYLKADTSRTRALRLAYTKRQTNRPVVGISWRRADGSKLSGSKSLALENWGPILCVAGATFVNLQYGDCRDEIAAAGEKFGVRIINDLTVDPLIDLDGFAAQVAAMDLVISISNTTAHVAGALGVPTWTLVPRGIGALWHWFRNRTDSPWYPAMTLLRQDTIDDWQPVVDKASHALVDFVAGWKPGP